VPGRRGWRLAVAVLVLDLLAVAVNRSLVEVRGPSMEPTLWPGDRLLTLPPVAALVRVGAVVVVGDPADPTHAVIKRLHARTADGRWEVRGDAPDRSTDSRHWGPLPQAAIRRVAVARWPDLRTPLWRDPELLTRSTRDAPPV
jgi:nickel-type superoxide dismutase maturation protease